MKLLIRSSTSFLTISFIAAVILWAPPWAFSVGVSIFAGQGIYELLTMLKKKDIQVYRVFGVSIGALIPIVVHCQLGFTQSGEVLFIVLSCFSLFLIQFLRKHVSPELDGIALTFFAIMYIGWFMSFLIKIKFLPEGSLWILYLFVVTKIADVGAYFIGSLWGKHPLIPAISPNKTIEGTWAGLFASAIASMLFINQLPYDFGLIHLVILGLVIGVVGQCGDLSESLIKRYAQSKDSGDMVPGFGGFLDMMDSVLFTGPLFYFYLMTLNI